MARWIINPRQLRPTATMPIILDHREAAAAIRAKDHRAWDIAAFLATLRDGGVETEGEPVDANDVASGGELLARLGCIACHTLPDEPRVDLKRGRIPLKDIGWKWKRHRTIWSVASPAWLGRPT